MEMGIERGPKWKESLQLPPIRPLNCGSFTRSGLRWPLIWPEVGPMKSASAVDVPLDLLQRWLKTVYHLADIIHLPVALVPAVVKTNLMAPRKDVTWRGQSNLPHKSYR